MSALTKIEQETVAEVTQLMESYVRSYSTADAKRVASLYTFPSGGSAVGDGYAAGAPNAEAMATGLDTYFNLRKGHWSPPTSTEISVAPINNVSAIGRIRWIFPPTSSTNQYNINSMYLCVKTADGWRMQFATQPVDSGIELVHENSSHQSWDFEGWEIYKSG